MKAWLGERFRAAAFSIDQFLGERPRFSWTAPNLRVFAAEVTEIDAWFDRACHAPDLQSVFNPN